MFKKFNPLNAIGSASSYISSKLPASPPTYFAEKWFAKDNIESKKTDTLANLAHFGATAALNVVSFCSGNTPEGNTGTKSDDGFCDYIKNLLTGNAKNLIEKIDPLNNPEINQKLPIFFKSILSRHSKINPPQPDEIQRAGYGSALNKSGSTKHFALWEKQSREVRDTISKYYDVDGNKIPISSFCDTANKGAASRGENLMYLPIESKSSGRSFGSLSNIEGFEIKYTGESPSNTAVFLFTQSSKLSRENIDIASKMAKENKCDVVLMDGFAIGRTASLLYRINSSHFRKALGKDRIDSLSNEFKNISIQDDFNEYKNFITDYAKKIKAESPDKKLIFTGNFLDATLALHTGISVRDSLNKEVQNKDSRSRDENKGDSVFFYISNPITSLSDISRNMNLREMLSRGGSLVSTFIGTGPKEVVGEKLEKGESAEKINYKTDKLLEQVPQNQRAIKYYSVNDMRRYFEKAYMGVEASIPPKDARFSFDNIGPLIDGMGNFMKRFEERNLLQEPSGSKDAISREASTIFSEGSTPTKAGNLTWTEGGSIKRDGAAYPVPSSATSLEASLSRLQVTDKDTGLLGKLSRQPSGSKNNTTPTLGDYS